MCAVKIVLIENLTPMKTSGLKMEKSNVHLSFTENNIKSIGTKSKGNKIFTEIRDSCNYESQVSAKAVNSAE